MRENQGGVEVLVVLLDVVRVVFRCLPFIHGVEVESRVVSLDGLEEGPESILEAASGHQSTTKAMWRNLHTTLDRFSVAGTLFHSSHPFRCRSWVMRARVRSANGDMAWARRVSILAQLDEVVRKRWGVYREQNAPNPPQASVHCRALGLRDLTVTRAWVSRRPD